MAPTRAALEKPKSAGNQRAAGRSRDEDADPRSHRDCFPAMRGSHDRTIRPTLRVHASATPSVMRVLRRG